MQLKMTCLHHKASVHVFKSSGYLVKASTLVNSFRKNVARMSSQSATPPPTSTHGRSDIAMETYHLPHWASQLASHPSLPSHRVVLAMHKTPIHKWRLPGVPADFQVYIKRDDMTGSTLSGNKIRKLEFLLADALQKGCHHVITCGGLQSNHCRATAVAASQLGLQAHLLLRTELTSTDTSTAVKGNMFLNQMCGARMYYTPKYAPYETELKPRMQQLSDYLQSTTHEKAYKICVGGSDLVGMHGYLNAFDELLNQGIAERFTDIVFATGSGGTADGLAIGNHLANSGLKIHGVAVSDDAEYFHRHVDNTLHCLQMDGITSMDILNVIEGHKGRGYGESTEEEKDFIISVARSSGIFLDPVYSGKAAMGLVKELNANPARFKGKNILFIHTGGLFGLFDGGVERHLVNKGNPDDIILWKHLDSPPF